MYISHLDLVNFKNYDQAEFSFSPKINCFIGNNGVGKTNLLDSIFYLSFCKSYFNPIDSQNIKHDKDFFVIQGKYSRDDSEENIYCGMKRNHKKQFKRNKTEYDRLSEHIGLIPLVMISPSDIELIDSGSEERRKFMNFVISQYDKSYLNDVITYNKALSQRNALLKQFARERFFDKDSLAIWTEQLIITGKRIYEVRKNFIRELIPVFQEYYDFVSGGLENVQLVYQSQLHSIEIEELFARSVDKDRAFQYTTAGLHKDDLDLMLGDYHIKRTGSQGQKKTYLMALKLAQFNFIQKLNGFKPILLLDDIFDKFDAERVSKIIFLVAEDKFGQIFITDTDQVRLEKILSATKIEYKIFKIAKD